MDRGDWQVTVHGVAELDTTEHTHRDMHNYLNTISKPSDKLILLVVCRQVRASLVAQSVKNLPAVQEIRVWSLGWEDPLEKETATHSSILAWKISWTEGCSPWGCKESGMTEQLTLMSRWQRCASPIWSGREADMGVTSHGDSFPVQTPVSDLNLDETGELETLTFLKPVL